MAKFDDRIRGIKDVSFDEAVESVKKDLRNQLLKIYFKDEPDFVKIFEDDEAYGRIFGYLLDNDDCRKSFAVHCRRRCVVRFAGVLFEFSESFPPRVANRVAIELGVKHTAYHLKRSEDYDLTSLQRLKFYNRALKIEMMMLKEDLEWNDDLNDDMFNEIQRFERNVERERAENEKLLLKGKSRKAEIELLNHRLLHEFGVEPPKKDRKPKKIKEKSKQNKDDGDEEKGEEDEDSIQGKLNSAKSSAKRGFTAIPN